MSEDVGCVEIAGEGFTVTTNETASPTQPSIEGTTV